jgi:hypothetical protein
MSVKASLMSVKRLLISVKRLPISVKFYLSNLRLGPGCKL